MSGKIYRIKQTENFTVLNTTGVRDQNLSWKAKGLHTYLMQLPEDWDINLEDLTGRSTDGKDSTASGMNELISVGYVHRVRVTDPATGQFRGYDYHVFQSPEHLRAVTGKPGYGLPVSGKPGTTNNDISKNDLFKKSLQTENLLSLFDKPEAAEQAFADWYLYRASVTENAWKFIGAVEASLKRLHQLSKGKAAAAREIVTYSISQTYTGLYAESKGRQKSNAGPAPAQHTSKNLITF